MHTDDDASRQGGMPSPGGADFSLRSLMIEWLARFVRSLVVPATVSRRRLKSALPGCAIPGLLFAVVTTIPAAVYDVGPGKPYATIGAVPGLVAGDTVNIHPGTYNEVKKWTISGSSGSPITIRGVGATRPLIDATGKDVSGSGSIPRGVFQIHGSHVVVEHLEFANARNGNNGAGIRITGGATNVTIRNCRIRDNDMGVMSDTSDAVLIDGCEIDHNGTSSFSGYSHNLYLGGTGITIRGCHIHDAVEGQNVKSRAHFTALLYNRIENSQDGEVGLVDAADTTSANSHAVLIGNVIIAKNRGSGWNNSRFVLFGAESGSAHNGTLYFINNTCIAGATSNTFLTISHADADLVARNNVFVGSTNLASLTAGASAIGSGNWAPTGASIPAGITGTLTGAAPGFVSGSDLHLATGSPCIDLGTAGATYLDGSGVSRSAVPTHTYEGVGVLTARSDNAAPDAGAYAGPSTGGGAGGGSTTPPSSGSSSGGGGCGVGGGVAGLAFALCLLMQMPRRLR
jgi:Right handed beta helix region